MNRDDLMNQHMTTTGPRAGKTLALEELKATMRSVELREKSVNLIARLCELDLLTPDTTVADARKIIRGAARACGRADIDNISITLYPETKLSTPREEDTALADDALAYFDELCAAHGKTA